MLAIVNPAAGGGLASRRWLRVAPKLRELRPDLRIVCGKGGRWVHEAIRRCLDHGETDFVAAGGDGTVNLVASELVALAGRHLPGVALGAIGLGSSNDFHKPADHPLLIAGAPARLDFDHAAPRDVCAARYIDENGVAHTRHFIVNASAGMTAEANWRFNHPGPLLAALKRLSAGAAIAWAALGAVALASPLSAELIIDGSHLGRIRFKNLGIVKNPHFAGALHYDSAFEPCSGAMHAHLTRAMSVPQLLRLLFWLSHGRFSGLPGTSSWQARHVCLRADQPLAIECDGEVVRAVQAEFFVLPRRLRVCPS